MPPLSLARMLLFAAANVGANLVFALTNNAFTLYLHPFGLPNWLVGFLSQERALVGGFVQPVVGMFSDRTKTGIGRRRPYFLVGVPLTVAALVVLAHHPPLWVVLTIMPIFAFFLMIAYDPYLALMVDITPEHQRGRVGALMALCGMGGYVLFLAIAVAFWQMSQTLVFYLVALGLVLGFAVTYFGIPEPPNGFPTSASSAASAAAGSSAAPTRERVSLIRYFRDVLSYRELSKYVGAQWFFWVGIGVAVPYLTLFGVRELHVEEGTAFALILALVLASAAASPLVGIAGDRFGKKRVLTIGLLVFSGLVAVCALVDRFDLMLALMLPVGIAHAVQNSLGFPLLTDLMPRDRAGEFSGLGSMVWSLGQPIGALIGGAVADLTGGYRAAFLVTTIAFLVSALLLRYVNERGNQP